MQRIVICRQWLSFLYENFYQRRFMNGQQNVKFANVFCCANLLPYLIAPLVQYTTKHTIHSTYNSNAIYNRYKLHAAFYIQLSIANQSVIPSMVNRNHSSTSCKAECFQDVSVVAGSSNANIHDVVTVSPMRKEKGASYFNGKMIDDKRSLRQYRFDTNVRRKLLETVTESGKGGGVVEAL